MDNIFLVIIVILVLFVIFNKQKLIVEKFDQVPSGFNSVVLSNNNGDLQALDYKSLLDLAIPKGGIIAWNGTTPPEGWAICDGNNGRPDLRGKFILGLNLAGASTPDKDENGQQPLTINTPGKKGGREKVKLIESEMPKHSHIGAMFNSRNEGGWVSGRDAEAGRRENVKVSETGGDQPHDNMPPYYVLAYIIKI